MLDAYKIYRLLFDLIEDQYGVNITFTLREKEKEEKENETELQEVHGKQRVSGRI